jgi:hypothetical protein
MDVRIGVINAPKELKLEFEGSADETYDTVRAAMDEDGDTVWLVDRFGGRVGVPKDKLAYVEIEGEDHAKRVGFGSG